jgi:C2 domain
VLLTVRSASINPSPPEGPWDAVPSEEPNPMGAIAKFAGLYDPVVGSGLAVLGAVTTTAPDPEKKLPDPFFTLTLNEALSTRTIQSSTLTDTLHPAWNYAAYIDLRTLRAAGLDLEVYDAEGDAPKEQIGTLNIPLAQLERVAAQFTPSDLHHVGGHLLALDIRIEPAPQGRRGPTAIALPLKQGVVHPDDADVPAGTVITVQVTGKGTVSDGGAFGLGCPGRELGPEGLAPDICNNYNLTEPSALARAPHGAAFVAIGRGDEMTALTFGPDSPCAQFAAKSGGPVLFGVNDHDPSNNSGTFTFTYTLSSPATPTEPCPSAPTNVAAVSTRR